MGPNDKIGFLINIFGMILIQCGITKKISLGLILIFMQYNTFSFYKNQFPHGIQAKGNVNKISVV